MSVIIEVTIKREMGEGQDTQTIETPITINSDHISIVMPRVEGGSVLMMASKERFLTKETRLEINRQICTRSFMDKVEKDLINERTKDKELKPVKPEVVEG